MSSGQMTMQYLLHEKIGDPDLLVGREKEFRNFGKWLANISKRLSNPQPPPINHQDSPSGRPDR